MANLAKLTELLAHITAPKTEFDMSVWVQDQEPEDIEVEIGPDGLAETPAVVADPNICGTAHCAAGWALALDGRPLLAPTDRSEVLIGTNTGTLSAKGLPIYDWRPTDEDEIVALAVEILGITEEQGRYLFLDLSDSEDLAVAYLAKLIHKESRELVKAAARKEFEADQHWLIEDGYTEKKYVSERLDQLNRKARS